MDIIKNLVIILGAIIAIWIIYKRIIPLTPIKSWSSTNKLQLMIALIVVLTLGGVFLSVYINKHGSSGIEIRSSIINLDIDKVEYLRINPDSTFQELELNQNPIVIDNKSELNLFTQEFRKLNEYKPNHPRTEWTIDIEIELKDKTQRYLEVTKTKDENGVIVFIYKKAWGGKLYIGTYRNDNLGTLIEKIIKENYNKTSA